MDLYKIFILPISTRIKKAFRFKARSHSFDRKRLHQKRIDLEEEITTLDKKISVLRDELVLETRTDEQMRLEGNITQNERVLSGLVNQLREVRRKLDD